VEVLPTNAKTLTINLDYLFFKAASTQPLHYNIITPFLSSKKAAFVSAAQPS